MFSGGTMRYLSLLFVSGALCAAQSPVADAAQRRDTAAVRAAIAQHANVNAAQPDGSTALHWAAHWSDLDMVRLLLGAGADVKAKNRFEATPLSEAVSGSAAIVELL